MKVWTISRNGQGDEEFFNSDQEGINYAKQRSLRAMCCFSLNDRRQFQCYEHGEVTTAGRREELGSEVREILINEMERDQMQFRGKRSPKKV